jgi:hypothetical protein
MSAVLGRLGRVAPAAAAVLLVAACSGGPSASPTASSVPAPSAIAEAQPTASILVEGVVTDSAHRPVANAEVECNGGVTCAPAHAQVIEQDGPDDGVKTNAEGRYTMVARGGGAFLMNASKRGYDATIREVAFPDASCSSDRAGCSVTVNFALADQP